MAVPKPDFTKQFGSAKTDLTPISDSNYLQGWDFVGSTPPTKNDFTYLQNLADQRSIWLFENYGAGRLINMQMFTASGTYTATTGAKSIIVEVQGAGGGAGGIGGAGTGTVAIGNGGGGGGYCKSRLTSGFTGGIAITVGVGGAGGNLAPTNGQPGGLSSFGSSIVANGGEGGLGQNQTAPPYSITGSLGGLATGGNIVNARGGASSNGAALNITSVLPGIGGAAVYGLPVLSPANNGATPYAATGYGAGGGGGYAFNRAGFSGGNGAGGVVIVWEYA